MKKIMNFIIPAIVVVYIGYVIVQNDKIARSEGSSLTEQLGLLAIAVVVVFVLNRIFNK